MKKITNQTIRQTRPRRVDVCFSEVKLQNLNLREVNFYCNIQQQTFIQLTPFFSCRKYLPLGSPLGRTTGKLPLQKTSPRKFIPQESSLPPPRKILPGKTSHPQEIPFPRQISSLEKSPPLHKQVCYVLRFTSFKKFPLSYLNIQSCNLGTRGQQKCMQN